MANKNSEVFVDCHCN